MKFQLLILKQQNNTQNIQKIFHIEKYYLKKMRLKNTTKCQKKKTKYSQKNYESDDSLKIINKWHSTLKGKIQ